MATTDKTKRSTPSTPAGEGGRIPVTDNGTDAYDPSLGEPSVERLLPLPDPKIAAPSA
jgi:hypothetical protein